MQSRCCWSDTCCWRGPSRKTSSSSSRRRPSKPCRTGGGRRRVPSSSSRPPAGPGRSGAPSTSTPSRGSASRCWRRGASCGPCAISTPAFSWRSRSSRIPASAPPSARRSIRARRGCSISSSRSRRPRCSTTWSAAATRKACWPWTSTRSLRCTRWRTRSRCTRRSSGRTTGAGSTASGPSSPAALPRRGSPRVAFPNRSAPARRNSPAARAASLCSCPPICSASSKPRSFSAAHERARRNRRNAARGKRPHRGRDRASRARRWSRPRLLAADHLAVGAGSRGAPLERPLAPAPAGAARRGDRRAPPAPALRARRMLLGAAAVAAQLDGRAPSGAGLALRERPHLAGGAGAAGGRARRPADDDRRRPARARQAAHPGAPSAIRGVAGAVGGSESGVRQGAGRVARPGTAVDHRRALAAPARAGRMAAARLQGLPPRPRADRAVRRARSAGRLLRARDAGGGRDRRRVHLTSARTRNPADRRTAARWIAVALAPDPTALGQRLSALPPIRDLGDAQARLEWVNPRPGSALPIPGLSRRSSLRIRDWSPPIRGKRCIGPGGAAPVRDAAEDASAVARLLGIDERRLRIARAADVATAREALRHSSELLCETPQPDVAALFQGLEEKELGPIAERLEEVLTATDLRRDHDEVARAILARTSQLLCKVFDAENVQQRVASVVGYKVFVEGGTRILDLVPQPLVCGNHLLTAREVRRRLRAAYRDALDKHAVKDRLCPVRAGKCPDEVAASVRKLFGLRRPELAAPAPSDSRRLDFPPPFGFSDGWVQKLDRCAQEACEALSNLRSEAPFGQFDGPVCPPREPGVERPQEVMLASPESPSSITLSSCDAHAGVRLTLRRLREAGTLVAIASSHPSRYGSENVTRQGRHPQLGRIYERVADLTDPDDVSRRADSVFEVALTPTVANQVFYFFSLRRRDY